ncbi:MAG: SpoIID/LytB domain-containing protein [Planctomycetota bacterium]
MTKPFTTRVLTGFVAIVIFAITGCASDPEPSGDIPGPPTIRVLLERDADAATVSATGTVTAATSGQTAPLLIRGSQTVRQADNGWYIGGQYFPGAARLRLTPGTDALITVNGEQRPGGFDFVTKSAGVFDLVNVVDMEQYLIGVVAGEMFSSWQLDALKAQAVAARTYALFQTKTLDRGHWDVFGDTRDQAYVPIDKWTDNDRRAVAETAGVVLAFAPDGKPRRIFKAYYSSTSGGPSIGAVDAFGDSPVNRIDPINTPVQYGDLDNQSSRYRWTIETTRREFDAAVKRWAADRNHPAAGLGPIVNVQVDARNDLRRPTRYVLIDRSGNTATVGAEPMRNLLGRVGKSWGNWVEPTVSGERIVFAGRGFGHGVGMSQYAVEALAQRGETWDQILKFCYPKVELVRAYRGKP